MPSTPQRNLSAPTIVIGAGPHGLAAAALLRRSGVPTVILERSGRVGASWAQRYDHLRLHTTPGTSSLPGLPVPRQAGPWVSRDDYVRYLERYVAHHQLDVRVTTPAQRIVRAEPGSAAQWLVHTPDGPVPTDAVVVATGRCHTPNIPHWPGRSTFTGTLLHSARYRSPAPYRGRDVLVVGAGNSGTEIAERPGRGRSRTGTDRSPYPTQHPSPLQRPMACGRPADGCPPARVARPHLPAHATSRGARPDLTGTTAAPYRPLYPQCPRRGQPGARPRLRRRRPVRAGASRSRPSRRFDGPDVLLADGTRLRPDTVIVATGYRPNLHDLVGSLGVLNEDGQPLAVGAQTHPEAARLYFTGYTNPLTGVLRQAGIEARAIAHALRREAVRVPLPSTRVGDRTTDTLHRGHASS